MGSPRGIKSVSQAVLEKHIEKYLKKQVEKQGGICYKFTSPAQRAVPDRICLFPTGLIVFVECKRPGKVPTPAQQREIDRIVKIGGLALHVSTYEQVDYFIKQMREAVNARTFSDPSTSSIIRPH